MNRVNFSLWMAVGLCVALAACSDGGRRRGGGGGPVVMVDGGGGGTDLGGGGGTDLGARDMGTGPMVDLGRRDMGSMCVPEPIDYVIGPYCSATTRTCVDGCTDGACLVACLRADASTDCLACANINVITCANDNGCLAQWNAFDCCYQANCTGSTDPNCVMNFCSAQDTAFGDCADRVLPTVTCPTTYNDCF